MLQLPKQLLSLTHLRKLCRPPGDAASPQALLLSGGLLQASLQDWCTRTPWARKLRL